VPTHRWTLNYYLPGVFQLSISRSIVTRLCLTWVHSHRWTSIHLSDMWQQNNRHSHKVYMHMSWYILVRVNASVGHNIAHDLATHHIYITTKESSFTRMNARFYIRHATRGMHKDRCSWGRGWGRWQMINQCIVLQY